MWCDAYGMPLMWNETIRCRVILRVRQLYCFSAVDQKWETYAGTVVPKRDASTAQVEPRLEFDGCRDEGVEIGLYCVAFELWDAFDGSDKAGVVE